MCETKTAPVRMLEDYYVEGPGFEHPHLSIKCDSEMDAATAVRLFTSLIERAEKAQDRARIVQNTLDFVAGERDALAEAIRLARKWRADWLQEASDKGAFSVGVPCIRASVESDPLVRHFDQALAALSHEAPSE